MVPHTILENENPRVSPSARQVEARWALNLCVGVLLAGEGLRGCGYEDVADSRYANMLYVYSCVYRVTRVMIVGKNISSSMWLVGIVVEMKEPRRSVQMMWNRV